MSTRFEVGVRAVGLCSASGLNLKEAVKSIRAERCSLRKLTRNTFIQGDFVGGEIPLDCPLQDRPENILMTALVPALAQAGLSTIEKRRTGVFVGTTSGMFAHSEMQAVSQLDRRSNFRVDLTSRGVGEVALRVAQFAGVGGPVMTYAVACTSSAYAMLEAWRFLRAGWIDHAIVIGFETLLNNTLHGFKSLMLYDAEAHRPFDKNRQGLQLGEACSVVVLDRKTHENYLFSMIGGAARNDYSNIAGADLTGGGVIKLLDSTLKSAGVNPDEIIAIKAHGTGTLDNDLAEGLGFKKFFGKVPKFASLKGYMGHTLGAAGALEVGTWLGCLADGFVPRSLGFAIVDEAIGLVPNVETYGSSPGSYLFTFFGFGGSSVGLVLNMSAAQSRGVFLAS